MYGSRINITLLLLAFIQFVMIATQGCGRHQGYQVVESPLTHFAYRPDTQPGAASLIDLACLLFFALQGQIDFDSLRHFMADSAIVARMYQVAGMQADEKEIKQVADSAQAKLYRQFLETASQPVVFRTSWNEAHLTKVHLLEVPGQRLPTQRLLLQAEAGKHTLRATALCFQLDNRWFIGEDLRYGR
ncbi:MAG: hypothetical protein NZL95_07540 [Chitinophagales bacterium]|nr:hypothetical protein [Chitinophagales bacterium]MDW8428388.1 hypothetical protein [Chitinophagales bacterium]